MGEIDITVFTPTYNRASTLPNVFESLLGQTFKRFEWIVVDDGSSDNTDTLVKGFVDKADFNIIYLKQKNAGKHIAQNKAVDIAQGQLFLPLDSDDTITSNALETLWGAWESIPKDERTNYSGVACHCKDQKGNRIGSPWPSAPMISNDLEITFKYHVKGEKWGAIRSDIMRRFKNDNVKGHFLDESTVWFRIAKYYKKLYIDECLRIYEVRDDSVQKRNRSLDKENAESRLHASLIFINEFYEWFKKYDLAGLIKHCLKVVYYSSLQRKRLLGKNGIIKKVEPALCKMIVLFAAPCGLMERLR